MNLFSYICSRNKVMMEKVKPLILISNDDGYHAKGLLSLIDMLQPMARLLVCAPDSARSGYACAFSAPTPLRLKLRRQWSDVQLWSCSGTPVDCVKMALSELCRDERPAMVISGINHGDNASVNMHYSRTMGVALEGCMKYIPSVAFSLCDYREDADFAPLAPYVQGMVRQVLRLGLPRGVCLNVNFPLTPQFAGVKMCRMAPGTWTNEVVKCHHPRGYDYYWLTGEYVSDEPQAQDTDRWALEHNFIAVTPTRIDVTAYDMMHYEILPDCG